MLLWYMKNVLLLFVFSDSANSHPSRSPVYTGPPAALQRGGPQPGAGRHVHLPANTSAAQGNAHLPSTQHTHVTWFKNVESPENASSDINYAGLTLLLSFSSAPWGSRRPPGSSPSAELQQWISEWPHCHHTSLLISHLLLTLLISHLHLHLPAQLWRHTSGLAPRLVFLSIGCHSIFRLLQTGIVQFLLQIYTKVNSAYSM